MNENMITQDDTQMPDGYGIHVVLTRMGHYCGYVSIPKSHPFHGKDYGEVEQLDVHGGLTFSGNCFGDTGWAFGFDCAHVGDNRDNCDAAYVHNQCLELLEQLRIRA